MNTEPVKTGDAMDVVERDWITILNAANSDLETCWQFSGDPDMIDAAGEIEAALDRSGAEICRRVRSFSELVEALEDLSEAVREMDSWSTRSNEALERADAAIAAANGTKP